MVSDHDVTNQTINVTHVLAGPEGVRRYSVVLHYAWPSELDLMATVAGLELVERAGGWDDRRYGETTTDHVSLYRLQRTD